MRRPSAGRLITGILETLYPSVCPSCSARTDNLLYSPFCRNCWSMIIPHRGASCRICATPFNAAAAGICGSCIKDPPPFSQVISYGIYDSVLAAAIHAFKFRKIRRLYKPLGSLMAELPLPPADAVVAVPLSAACLRERGFNQSLLLAKTIAAATRAPLFPDGLLKKGETLPQIGLTAKERSANLRGAFTAGRSFRGMNLLLVDDVVTTGATARACAQELARAGASRIVVAALARAGTL
ncbi:MAG: ComF family protein [Nitrospiraceae bacterium]|nr:ComF family protein [Nitrospiraceae bacterium]